MTSAFGMQMPGRTFSGNGIGGADYKYSFNGKEDDKSSGWFTQDYGFRNYDYRLGRFFSQDPLFRIYPELTPYQFASNTPIQAIDLDGLEAEGATGASGAGASAGGSAGASTGNGGASGSSAAGNQAAQGSQNFQSNTTYNPTPSTNMFATERFWSRSESSQPASVNVSANINASFQFYWPTYTIYQDLTPSIYENARIALMVNPKLEFLNYIGTQDYNRTWSGCGKDNGCSAVSGGLMQCEEFPPACTFQGGQGSFITCVPKSEQATQAGQIGAMVTANNMKKGDMFQVKLVASQKQDVPQPNMMPVPNPTKKPKPLIQVPISNDGVIILKPNSNRDIGKRVLQTTGIIAVLEIMTEFVLTNPWILAL